MFLNRGTVNDELWQTGKTDMNHYYLSADGGGSKLAVMLFDDQMKLLGSGKSGPVNPRFVPMQMVHDNMISSIEQCLQRQKISSLSNLYISMPGPADLFASLLGQKIQLDKTTRLSEGEMALLAGRYADRGIVALAGTGSGVFNVNGEQSTHIGGWGALFDDEGSGYAIGTAAINAAIKSFDRRGRRTMLEKTVVEHFQLENLSSIIEHVYGSANYRGIIASLTVTVLRTADRGDRTARSIMQKAGYQMAGQVITLIRRDHLPPDQTVMVAGSVWKGNAYMFDAFSNRLKEKYPKMQLAFPVFEPVVGGAVKACRQLSKTIDNSTINCLTSEFMQYLYKF